MSCNMSCFHLQEEHVLLFTQVIKQLQIVLMNVHQMMIVSMIGSVVLMSVEDVLVLTLLRCVR